VATRADQINHDMPSSVAARRGSAGALRETSVPRSTGAARAGSRVGSGDSVGVTSTTAMGVGVGSWLGICSGASVGAGVGGAVLPSVGATVRMTGASVAGVGGGAVGPGGGGATVGAGCAAVGTGVGGVVGTGVGGAVGAGVGAGPSTTTVPVIAGCFEQWYENVPALVNVFVYGVLFCTAIGLAPANTT
jgi:hypothetical protein